MVTKLAAGQPCTVTASEVQSVVDSWQPVAGLLDPASGLFQIAGLDPPKAPQLAPGTDASSLAADQEIVGGFIALCLSM